MAAAINAEVRGALSILAKLQRLLPIATDDSGVQWFDANQVCKLLGYSKYTPLSSLNLIKKENGSCVKTITSGNALTKVINKEGIMLVIMTTTNIRVKDEETNKFWLLRSFLTETIQSQTDILFFGGQAKPPVPQIEKRPAQLPHATLNIIKFKEILNKFDLKFDESDQKFKAYDEKFDDIDKQLKDLQKKKIRIYLFIK
ncbi:uncharacterized protein LOC107980623 [Nasonia vitripennis]|uniref:Bro-N domain-containing protein n=1 Tax=Nasonia vitripennis TaxID=7425 RepID=A0A7M7ITZ6_NASVI|nr:uncharacterized protein LOC107980623 [Nasonia vitripennis]